MELHLLLDSSSLKVHFPYSVTVDPRLDLFGTGRILGASRIHAKKGQLPPFWRPLGSSMFCLKTAQSSFLGGKKFRPFRATSTKLAPLAAARRSFHRTYRRPPTGPAGGPESAGVRGVRGVHGSHGDL